jgi:hypothetical protein
MKFIELIKPSIIIAEVLLVIIGLIMMVAFALDPTNYAILNNVLLTILIVAQLLTATVLIQVYERLGGRKR